MNFDPNDAAKDLLLVGLLKVLDRVAAEGGEIIAMQIVTDIHTACESFEFPELNAEQTRAVRCAFDIKMAAIEQGLLSTTQRAARKGDKRTDEPEI